MTVFYLDCILLLMTALSFILLPLIRKKQKWSLSILITLLFLPMVSISLYRYWGAGGEISALIKNQQQIERVRQELSTLHGVNDVIKKLEHHLQEHPNSAEGWYLLGRLYFTTGNSDQARDAFKRANRLDPQDKRIQEQLLLTLKQLKFNQKSQEINNKKL